MYYKDNIKEKAFGFDDVLITPLLSDVSSRDIVDISVKLSNNLTLDFPLIASPMVGVVNGRFAHLLSELGGLAILHRFYPSRKKMLADLKNNISEKDNFGVSVGVGDTNIEELLDTGAKIILVDTANGYTKKLRDYCEVIKRIIINRNSKVLLMAGNVVTLDGCVALNNSGCDIIRVGIGGGSACSTRNKTGIGVPNISAIMNCIPENNPFTDMIITNMDYKIVIDGGIKNSGDFVKSIVAGADLGMSGMLFAECYEAPNKGWLYGMSSRTHMEKIKKEIKSVEGIDIPVTKKHSLKKFVREFGYGIKSAGTYLNAKNLLEMYSNGEFVIVSDTAIKKGL